jgi:hypothetical protein
MKHAENQRVLIIALLKAFAIDRFQSLSSIQGRVKLEDEADEF